MHTEYTTNLIFLLILNEKRQMFQHRNRRGDKTLDKTILRIIVYFVLLGSSSANKS